LWQRDPKTPDKKPDAASTRIQVQQLRTLDSTTTKQRIHRFIIKKWPECTSTRESFELQNNEKQVMDSPLDFGRGIWGAGVGAFWNNTKLPVL